MVIIWIYRARDGYAIVHEPLRNHFYYRMAEGHLYRQGHHRQGGTDGEGHGEIVIGKYSNN